MFETKKILGEVEKHLLSILVEYKLYVLSYTIF